MDSNPVLLIFLGFLIFMMGLVAAFFVRGMIHDEVDVTVDKKLDERGIVPRKRTP